MGMGGWQVLSVASGPKAAGDLLSTLPPEDHPPKPILRVCADQGSVPRTFT